MKALQGTSRKGANAEARDAHSVTGDSGSSQHDAQNSRGRAPVVHLVSSCTVGSTIIVRSTGGLLVSHTSWVPELDVPLAMRIRTLYQTGDWTWDALSSQFDVNRTAIRSVINGTWTGFRKAGIKAEPLPDRRWMLRPASWTSQGRRPHRRTRPIASPAP